MPTLPFETIATEYDKLNDLLSWGMHRLWKRKLVRLLWKNRPSENDRVLDVATGTGDLPALFLRKHVDVVGVDPCKEMLDQAQRRMPKETWLLAGAESLPVDDDSVGILSCAFGVRNFRDRAIAFAEWKRVLVGGGIAGVIEIHPIGKGWLRKPIELYWKYVVPLFGQLLASRGSYEYLRDSGAAFLTPAAMRAEIVAAGFETIYFVSLFPCGMVSLTLFRNAKRGQESIERGGDRILRNHRRSHGTVGI